MSGLISLFGKAPNESISDAAVLFLPAHPNKQLSIYYFSDIERQAFIP